MTKRSEGGRSAISPVLHAALWMGGAILSFCAMAVSVRELSGAHGPFQILFFRSVFGALVLGLVVARLGPGLLRSSQWSWHAVRHSLHFVAQVGWVYSIALLPLAQVFAIEFTSPVWGSVLAVLLLGERLSRGRLLALCAGFAGILVILRPGLDALPSAALVMLASAAGFGLVNVLTKRLTRTDRPVTILFWMCAVQTLLALPVSVAGWTTPTLAETPWLVLVGLCGLSAHYCLNKGLSLADATVVLPMEFLRLPVIALAGLALYREPLDPWVLAGGAIIATGVWLNLRGEVRRQG
jgi:drug/metabolite transporter (DMT)-like permease